ncbi:MAG TPA: NAD-dependent epimerase/dehydratase family protein [Thermoanaerobaculia bacterium]|nr:NAD-dependent epimerase/dehydratase family protein [Thermoanaerobaculia bacterium]
MPIRLPILVTGGLGFLGSHLCTRLATAGETVRILARPERRAEAPDSPHEIVWGDVRDPAAVERAVRGTEVVIHLASNFRRAGSDAKEAYPINVEGTRNVAEACLRAGVRQLIHCSTIGVHGSVVEVPAREESALSPLDLYQETKLLAEDEVWRAHRRDGLPATVLRPASIYGPGDRRMLKLFRLIQKRRYVMLGDGKAFFHPAYVEDVADAFVLALRNERADGETFIVGGEEYVSLNEVVAMIAEELGVPPPRLRFPLAPIMALAALCERLCAPFGVEPPLHRRRVSFFWSRRAFSIEKARQVLGFQPRFSLREGMRATIRWYRERGWL